MLWGQRNIAHLLWSWSWATQFLKQSSATKEGWVSRPCSTERGLGFVPRLSQAYRRYPRKSAPSLSWLVLISSFPVPKFVKPISCIARLPGSKHCTHFSSVLFCSASSAHSHLLAGCIYPNVRCGMVGCGGDEGNEARDTSADTHTHTYSWKCGAALASASHQFVFESRVSLPFSGTN